MRVAIWSHACENTYVSSAAVDRFEQQINKRSFEREAPGGVDEIARDKQQRDSVLSGAAGVTGEDVGIAEKSRLV